MERTSKMNLHDDLPGRNSHGSAVSEAPQPEWDPVSELDSLCSSLFDP